MLLSMNHRVVADGEDETSVSKTSWSLACRGRLGSGSFSSVDAWCLLISVRTQLCWWREGSEEQPLPSFSLNSRAGSIPGSQANNLLEIYPGTHGDKPVYYNHVTD